MSRSRFPSDQGTCLRPSAPEEHASAESSMPRPCSAAALRNGDGSLADVAVTIANRELLMLGPAGKTRESAFLPDPSSYSDRSGGQRNLPVLIGSGTGAALEEITSHLEKAYGKNFHLAVVDKEESILVQNQVRRRFAVYPGILWVSASSSAFVLKELTLWQQGLGGKALFPLANPFYLRIDREYYDAVRKACESSSRANFWDKARYCKFKEAPRLLLLTSNYFLMGEIVSACERMGLAYRLLQVPAGEVGQEGFVEQVLSSVVEFKPDFVFTINHLGIDREGVLVDLLEQLRLPLASWFVDNPHLILYLYNRLVTPWTSIFTWDADNLPSLAELGFEHVSYLPLGVDATRFRPASSERSGYPGLPSSWNRDIAFVGNSMVNKVRERLKKSTLPESLESSYKQVAADFGAGVDRSVAAFLSREHPGLMPDFQALENAEQRLNYETLLTWEATLQYRLSCIRSILPLSPLIVGDSGWHELLKGPHPWHYHKEMNYYQDLPRFYPNARINFNCTSKQMKGAVNQRVFDVPATESFLLCDYREQVENLFEPGTEIVCYKTPEEAAELAAEFLSRPGDRRRIAKAARQRILREHTYEHRLRTLIETMRAIYA